MEKDKKFQILLELFYRIINRIKEIEKRPFYFGTNCKLYKSEADVIEIVAVHPEYNVTEIANSLGITKGAISQVAGKLKAKGLAIKVKVKGNEKNTFLRLTEKGFQAFEAYRNFRENYFKELINLFNSLNEERVEFLESVFKKIDESIRLFMMEKSNF